MSQSLGEWLWWRFGRGHRGAQARWDLVSQIDKTYWEHEARAVRWAVEGGVTEEALVEWQCPACGATTRARMADRPGEAP